ncbi:hypothetical protein, partial [Christiangramia aquimixticola]|uniref:hypothetical protein n=1 Tax=Christiangramia aquimixticola TaxID=1697558 RepID=UPI003AA8EAD9
PPFFRNYKIKHMETKKMTWTKEELKVYILLMCANADAVKTDDEIDLIRSQVDSEAYEKISREFANDSEEEGLDKIEENIAHHEYSHKELQHLYEEMRDVFISDKNFCLMERHLERVLQNILY